MICAVFISNAHTYNIITRILIPTRQITHIVYANAYHRCRSGTDSATYNIDECERVQVRVRVPVPMCVSVIETVIQRLCVFKGHFYIDSIIWTLCRFSITLFIPLRRANTASYGTLHLTHLTIYSIHKMQRTKKNKFYFYPRKLTYNSVNHKIFFFSFSQKLVKFWIF